MINYYYFFVVSNNCVEKKLYFCTINRITMANKDLNRLKVVLVEKHKTAKWLAEQMEKDPATISKWCTNKAQPSLETIKKIAEILQVKKSDLVSNEPF